MVSSDDRKDRVKAFFNRLENEGSLHGHYLQFGIPQNQATDISQMRVSLRNGRTFRLKQYIAVQKRRTEWLWNEMPSMADLITQIGDREKPQSTLRNYCNQECEGISRMAKMRWADWNGHTWFSLEHDGLGVGLSGNIDEKDAARAATEWSSKALGYTQIVNAKPMPTHDQGEKWAWARQKRAPKVVTIPATKQSESISNKLSEAHRTHT